MCRALSVTPAAYQTKCPNKEYPEEPAPLETENPILRTFRLLKNDMVKVKNFVLPSGSKAPTKPDDQLDIRDFAIKQTETTEFQTHCDVLIIGGGGIGSSIAYWLKKRAFSGLNVVVLEKDPTVATVIFM